MVLLGLQRRGPARLALIVVGISEIVLALVLRRSAAKPDTAISWSGHRAGTARQ
ncbi:hypothetical protein ACWEOZ_21130 [Actinoplanes sp. NPDC004185]